MDNKQIIYVVMKNHGKQKSRPRLVPVGVCATRETAMLITSCMTALTKGSRFNHRNPVPHIYEFPLLDSTHDSELSDILTELIELETTALRDRDLVASPHCTPKQLAEIHNRESHRISRFYDLDIQRTKLFHNLGVDP